MVNEIQLILNLIVPITTLILFVRVMLQDRDQSARSFEALALSLDQLKKMVEKLEYKVDEINERLNAHTVDLSKIDLRVTALENRMGDIEDRCGAHTDVLAKLKAKEKK
ncbi:MAG: hypothetical protein KHZ79_06275 [Atopobium minutum]|uniref:Uncharacterized protein n=1 Tax=Atopobium minutum TaxID=1381 RepID=A0AB38A4T0_9ACTN|nr:hypothetical protein [Atopobium minutum]MBS4873961.1 hypothetical protein [Atopobium minutum]SEB43353.1 hypothetical protein SAMN04489746_0205 [Atopobium minutum]